MRYFKTPEEYLKDYHPGKMKVTREQFVTNWIEGNHSKAVALADYTPGEKPPGAIRQLFGMVAQVGMYSDNSTTGRQSIVYTAQQELDRYRRFQSVEERLREIEAEYRYAWALADEYFHGAARRQAAAEAEAEHYRRMGEAVADAMYERVQAQRA